MFNDPEPETKKPVKKATPKLFINASKHNIFTEKGRIGAKEMVTMLPSEAKKYKGLEEV